MNREAIAPPWPRQPFIGLALAAIAGILVADSFARPAVGLLGMILCGVPALVRPRALLTYGFVAASFFALHALQLANAPGALLALELGVQPQAAVVQGWIVSEPKVSERKTASFQLRATSIELHGVTRPCRITFLARWRGDVRYGDEVRIFGVLMPIDGPRNPGEFDRRRYLARQDIRTAFVSRYPENGRILARGGGHPILRAAHASRRLMDAALGRGLEGAPNQHSLISGIVLGLRDATPDEVEEEFQQTGTIHLFAVAGLHVGIVAFLLWTIARALRFPRKLSICLIVPALFFYAAITGWNTASVRAATMAAVVLGGAFLERRVSPGNSLAAAAFLLLGADPQQLFSMGFQLSFAVVGTIIFLADRVGRSLVRWVQPDPFLPAALIGRIPRFGLKIWRAVARGASVSLAAWLGSLLLIFPYFYLITPIALFANLAVVPLAFFVLAFGLMSLLSSLVAPWLALIFNNANWSLASVILATVNFFAHAPAGHIYLELPSWPKGELTEITALDLGAGGAVHVRGRKNDWMFDVGAERDFRRVVRGYLRSRGVNRLDGLVLSHGDAAHIGAAASILRSFRPREIIDTAAPDRSAAHRSLISSFATEHVSRKFWAAGAEANLDPEIVAHVLYPPADLVAVNADDQTLVVQLEVDKVWRVLLTFDSGEETERFLFEHKADLRSDVLIKGQHHSGTSGSTEFLERVHPALIIASSPPFPESERIKDDWASAVAAGGSKLFRQDETGAVTLRFYHDHWEA
ncbi:MAG: ComEC/Rec2 family competence protein, partial [Verrucomicrobiota bacterium]|nr:ComEC/Rec2 family competence protein [Verrucomicrobiota bacterium]